MDALQHLGGILAAPHQHDAFDAAVLSPTPKMPVGGAAPIFTLPMSRTKTGTPFASATTMFSMSLIDLHQSDAADHHRLLTVVEQRAAGVLIVGSDRLRDLPDRQVVLVQRQRIDLDLVLLHQSAERRDVRDAGHLPEARLDHPVLSSRSCDVAVALALRRRSGTVRRSAWTAARASA